MTTQTISKSDYWKLTRAWNQWEKADRSGKNKDFFKFQQFFDRLPLICRCAIETRIKTGEGWEVVS